MVASLIKIYQRQKNPHDRRSTIIQEHACYYLAYLRTPEALEFLEISLEQESPKWVQRGIMVGLALAAHRSDILDRYIDILNRDAEAASVNLGYHLVYYGDQPLGQGFGDQGGRKCEGTVGAILRHLRSESYRNAWALDLITLRMLLERRGIIVLHTDDQYLAILKEFLNKDYPEQGIRFQQEKEHLSTILKKEKLL